MNFNFHLIAVDNAFAQAANLDVAALVAATSGQYDEAALWTMAEYLDWVAAEGQMPSLTTLRCTNALREGLKHCGLELALKLAAMSPTVHSMVVVLEEQPLLACA